METILITGSEGLVGNSLCSQLEGLNYKVKRFDKSLNVHSPQDIRNLDTLIQALKGVDGVVHLAAVSRVIWGEQDPKTCWDTNVGGASNLVEAALRQMKPPFLIFASSREVYGNVSSPAVESFPYNPLSVYGESKVAGEKIFLNARNSGLKTGVVRLSNVYGSPFDHSDRVIPAFVKAALNDSRLVVDSPNSTYDFTHVSDVTHGIVNMIKLVRDGIQTSPIHLLTGQATSLHELAKMVIGITGSSSAISVGQPRTYGASSFFGINENAKTILNWTPRIDLEIGIKKLIADFEKLAESAHQMN